MKILNIWYNNNMHNNSNKYNKHNRCHLNYNQDQNYYNKKIYKCNNNNNSNKMKCLMN